MVPSCVSQPALAVQSPQPTSQGPDCVQLPVLHASPACGMSQDMPQPPQWARLVLVLTSQPFAVGVSLSQFAKFALQLMIAQLPVAQVAVALALLHDAPQAPQFVSELSCVSQPLSLLPSQSPQPIAQVGSQPVAPQAVLPWALVQASPHARQSLVVPSRVSHPASALQSAQS